MAFLKYTAATPATTTNSEDWAKSQGITCSTCGINFMSQNDLERHAESCCN